MKSVLIVQSSPLGELSNSRKLIKMLDEKLSQCNAEIKVRDLAVDPPPHLNIQTLNDIRSGEEGFKGNSDSSIQLSNDLISELKESSLIIIGAPMWNFGIPSSLKSWIDHIAVAGKTFSYSEKGPVGLLKDKKAIIAVASGGVYSGEMSSYDFNTPYLKAVLGFIGITDVQIVRLEGIAFPDNMENAISNAQKDIDSIIL